MILEQKTFDEYGYWPDELSPQSTKPILAACDDCGIIRITSKNTYSCLCKSCCEKGSKNSFWGKHHSEETKQKMGKAKKGKYTGENNHKWKPKVKCICLECGKEFEVVPSVRIKGCGKYCCRICARKNLTLPKHKTKPERIFEVICKNYNLPFKYTGDGRFWIHNINPDFVECNGKKMAVEVFGDYWHSPLLNYNLREDKTLPYRKRILKSYGWKLIVIWERDLLRDDAEQFVLSELKKNKAL